MLITATKQLSTRQNLISGRLSEAITERSFSDYSVALSYLRGTDSGVIPTELLRKPQGYFSLSLSPVRQMPTFDGLGGAIKLIANFSVKGFPDFQVERDILIADLQLVATTVDLNGEIFHGVKVSGAPFDLSHTLTPVPVGLRGVVVSKTDHETPVDGASVEIAGTPIVTTNTEGRFTVPTLPVVKTLDVKITKGTATQTFQHRPNFSVPMNTIARAVAI